MRDAEKAALALVGILVVIALLNFGKLTVSGGPGGSKLALSYQRTGG